MIRLLALLVLLALLTGCGPRAAAVCEEFDRSYKSYNRMLRWQEIENAGMLYMESDKRDEFMKFADEFRKKKVTITDYRILTTECLPEKFSGEVVAEFDYYIMPSNRIKSLSYRQKWLYRDAVRTWKLTGGFPLFE